MATKAGTRRLSEVARHLSVPDGITSTGWPDVLTTCRKMGIRFDRWQDGAGRLILAKRAGGLLAATVDGVGMSLPRQVGKTFLVAGLIFGLCVNTPGLLVIWSAHHGRTHEETFLAMQGYAKRAKIAPYVDKVYTGSGDEEVRLLNGSRILFGAREAGFGRGIPGVDVLIFDEGQILSEKAMQNMLATMNTSRLGLHMYIGTPPRPEDRSETFTAMRRQALAEELHDGVWIECGADLGCDPNDRAQWAKANPSYPHRTPVQSILRLQRKLSADGFMREALGVWDPLVTQADVFKGAWADCRDPDSLLVGPRSLAVDVAPDQSYASLAVCGVRADGLRHVEMRRQRGMGWIAGAVADQFERRTVAGPVVLAGRMAAALRPDLEQSGRDVLVMSAGDYLAACAQFAEAVESGQVRHIGQDELDAAVSGAAWKETPDGRYLNRRGAADITPLVACVAARWAAVRLDDPDYDVADSYL